jgi:excisionase family DNA binding protein
MTSQSSASLDSPSAASASTYHFEPLLTDEQAAALLGLHPKNLQRLARTAEIPAHRIGRFWRYRASELDEWLKAAVSSGSQSVANEEKF